MYKSEKDRKVSEKEIIKILNEFHPTLNVNKVKETFIKDYMSHQILWWKCHVCGKDWKSTLYARLFKGTICQRCKERNHKKSLSIEGASYIKDIIKEINNISNGMEYNIYNFLENKRAYIENADTIKGKLKRISLIMEVLKKNISVMARNNVKRHST